MTSNWRRIDEEPLQCPCGKVLRVLPINCRCGRRYDWDGEIVWNPGSSDDPPRRIAATTKAFRYAEALARWVKAGRPVRSTEEVDRILDICQACEYYENETCQKCGCVIRKKPAAFRNKLKMATESCPVEKWTAEVE